MERSSGSSSINSSSSHSSSTFLMHTFAVHKCAVWASTHSRVHLGHVLEVEGRPLPVILHSPPECRVYRFGWPGAGSFFSHSDRHLHIGLCCPRSVQNNGSTLWRSQYMYGLSVQNHGRKHILTITIHVCTGSVTYYVRDKTTETHYDGTDICIGTQAISHRKKCPGTPG